jgi:NAD(P)-dependent dehydrogenase (short-subunit alcohol dehydrogenase family)
MAGLIGAAALVSTSPVNGVPAKQNRRTGICGGAMVNAVCPIEAAMAERAFRDPAVSKRMLAMHPLGRFGKPIEIAEAVLWMCSGKSSFMTGHEIVLDGGMLAGPQTGA